MASSPPTSLKPFTKPTTPSTPASTPWASIVAEADRCCAKSRKRTAALTDLCRLPTRMGIPTRFRRVKRRSEINSAPCRHEPQPGHPGLQSRPSIPPPRYKIDAVIALAVLVLLLALWRLVNRQTVSRAPARLDNCDQRVRAIRRPAGAERLGAGAAEGSLPWSDHVLGPYSRGPLHRTNNVPAAPAPKSNAGDQW